MSQIEKPISKHLLLYNRLNKERKGGVIEGEERMKVNLSINDQDFNEIKW